MRWLLFSFSFTRCLRFFFHLLFPIEFQMQISPVKTLIKTTFFHFIQFDKFFSSSARTQKPLTDIIFC